MAKYIAHKREDGCEQTVKEHLEGTARLAKTFAKAFGAEEQGELVGVMHDIGKYSKEFQNRILNNGPKVDHSSAGAYECALKSQVYAAFCIAGHHSGLPDLGGLSDYSEGTLRGRLNRAFKSEIPNYNTWKEEISFPSAAFPKLPKDGNSLSEAFFIRMLYSCLVDADYLDTELFMKSGEVYRDTGEELPVLLKRLEKYIENWFPPKGELNKKRCAILGSCIREAKKNPGVFTLTVPTGGGKTIASLAFALNHAICNEMRRVIYVVPYTSIIEQTASIFRQILGDRNVLEHHSGIEYDSDDRVTQEAVQMSLATENWDMPVIVTTAVQFYESLFASKSSKCRKIHNIANSVIVFDEAQMIPLPYLHPCVYSISQLVRFYGVTAVLCTATQPALEDIFKIYLPGVKPQEICPQELSSDSIFNRVTIVQEGKITWAEIVHRMNLKEQILCIVNSRKKARDIYSGLCGEGCYHLSTLMIPAHRKEKLNEIRKRLKEGKTCKVISTSLIEAGVDVDFPEVLREEAGLDSIIQSAGRCNREGHQSTEKSIVTVFLPETPPPALFQMNIQATQIVAGKTAKLNSPEAIQLYYKELLFRKGPSLDRYRIIEKLKNGSLPFRTVSNEFHLIDSDTVTVYIPIDKGAGLLDQIRQGDMSRSVMRKLNQYGVNLYRQHFQALWECGDVMMMNGIYYLSNLALYDMNCGLSLGNYSGRAEFI
ncbi:MAG TPA: CRISPR-associated helicase/endonuclease Cas3 [Lachnospiraceae bacterium]|nr:CRISPR-associated helicase/endonuclease Cas3 [Lachnospiraceae bacterium]